MNIVTPKELHDLYLEATKELNPDSYNPDAQKKYSELTEEQKSIDKYIANKINRKFADFCKRFIG